MEEKVLLPLKDGWYEMEFRRVYSQLYRNERALTKAMEYYEGCKFPYVERESHYRMENLKFWLKPNKSIEEFNSHDKRSHRKTSSFLFSDVKEIVGNFPLDVVFLSLGVSMPNPFGNPQGTIRKCLQGMKNNDIMPGNFANVSWNRGMCYYDALEDGLTGEKSEFEISLKEPTYDRPVLVITERYDEGRMLGSYIGFLHKKGIGAYASWEKQKGIPGFSFIAKDWSCGFPPVTDSLDMF